MQPFNEYNASSFSVALWENISNGVVYARKEMPFVYGQKAFLFMYALQHKKQTFGV